MTALATHELTKEYAVGFWRKRPYRALDRLTLEVAPGEVFGFLGPNGAGKTTTLKLLMRLVFPTSGRAEILGRPVGDLDVRRRIGYLPETPLLLRLPDRGRAAGLLRRPLRLSAARSARRRVSTPARRSGARRRASPAAAQVLEGHAAARRHCPGAAQRTRTGDSRRADVGARSARSPRRALAHPAPARPRLHGVLQLSRPERRRGALQPGRHSCQRAAHHFGPSHGHARVPDSRLGSGGSRGAPVRCSRR